MTTPWLAARSRPSRTRGRRNGTRAAGTRCERARSVNRPQRCTRGSRAHHPRPAPRSAPRSRLRCAGTCEGSGGTRRWRCDTSGGCAGRAAESHVAHVPVHVAECRLTLVQLQELHLCSTQTTSSSCASSSDERISSSVPCVSSFMRAGTGRRYSARKSAMTCTVTSMTRRIPAYEDPLYSRITASLGGNNEDPVLRLRT